MKRQLLFVHSPWVGPSTWQSVAKAANRDGFAVSVRDLRPAVVANDLHRLIDTATAEASSERVVVIGHSGAGMFLPSLGERLGSRREALVFVDAVIPPETGHAQASESLRELGHELATEGVLPRWSRWWSEGRVEALLGDDFAAFDEESPEVSLAFLEHSIMVPAGWSEWPCSYIQLSPAYNDEAAEASDRGWHVEKVDSHHLGTITHPDSVWSAIRSFVDR